ncbi:MAG: hypothetical protein ACK4N5_22430, partial [Myxococcales bacterium]
PGPHDGNGNAKTVQVAFDVTFDTFFSTVQDAAKPKSVILRLVYPSLLDGTPLTCTALKDKAGRTSATRTQLDDDPQLNQVLRRLTPVTWSGGTTGPVTFSIPAAPIPRGRFFLLYAEAWYGQREQNLPTGNLASSDCKEGIDLYTAQDGVRLTARFPRP